MNNRRFLIAIAAVVGMLNTAGVGAAAEPRSLELGNALIAPFAKGGSRAELLAGCKAALAEARAGSYDAEFRSLVDALEHVPGPPKGYDKAPAQRSQDEAIRAAIYDFNGDRPYKLDDVMPGDVIRAAGTAALGPLMETLDDATPTRVIGEEEGLSLTILLRREDIALRYMEGIAGISLFQRTQGRGGQFHNDPQRAVFLAKIRAWWETAKGKSQADLLRMQIERYGMGEWEVLQLAELEGPESVRDDVLKLLGREEAFCEGPLALAVGELDPPPILRAALGRFRNHKAVAVDYTLLARCGDQAIYQELAAQAATDPKPWGGTDLAEDVARRQNWGIPLLAAMLTQTKGQEYSPGQLLSAADFAMNHFQKLVGRDFGYDFRGPQAERSAAIEKARAWWESEGKTAMADKIKEPHEYVVTDVFATEEQITARVSAIAANDEAAVRAAVAGLPKCYAVSVQRALLTRLSREREAKFRLAILDKIGGRAMWEAPALAECFEHDTDTAVRIAAGKLLLALEARPGLGTYETTLAAVRRVADDAKAPQELLQIAAQLLLKADSSLDDSRLRRLRDHLPADKALDRHFEQLERRRHPEYAIM